MTTPARSWPQVVGLSLVCALLSVLVASAWGDFVERPRDYLVSGGVAAAVVAALGIALDRWVPRPLVLLAQAVAGLGWLQWHFADQGRLWHSVREGAILANSVEAPIPAAQSATAPFFAVCVLALSLGLSLFAVTLGRAGLTGLPLLLALTVPIATLDRALPLGTLLGALALFGLLLVIEHRGHADAWGPVVGRVSHGHLAGVVTTLAVVAGVLGLAVAAVVPLGSGLQLNDGAGDGRGRTSVTNPMVEIRRGLVNQSSVPMLTAVTDDPTPRYLRLAALDRFDGDRWLPSPRDLPQENRITEGIPEAPGLGPNVPGNQHEWGLTYTESFDSRWLAVPYPYLSVEISAGDYRYDEDTLDLFNTAGTDHSGPYAGYRVIGFNPSFSADDLDGAGSPPAGIEDDMTVLPDQMPERITQIASAVAGEARTDYGRVAALQDWFRNSGGFRYSLWDGPSTAGLAALEEFITTAKVGYCEQFAAAMAVMSRALGVPARVAVGFGRPSSADGDNSFTYTGKSLHAWTEVYFEGYGWVVFDPTPAVQSGEAPGYSRGIDQEEDRTSPSVTSTPSAQPAPTRPERDPGADTSDTDDEGRPWWVLGVVALLVLAALTPRVVRSRQRHRRHEVLARGGTASTVARALWQELRATVIDHRLPWVAHRSPRRTLRELRRHLEPTRPESLAIDEFVAFVERARYARDFELNAEELERVRSAYETVGSLVQRQATRGEARKARWRPQSVWGGSDRDPDGSDQ